MLGNLQMHTPPMDWEDVQQVFKEEFAGQGPLEVFAAFECEPIAAASIGPVYHA
jgi:predicted unusual protein kinase regulating ubiquinone biosynthesis (AarF/ABC1/UbiB family)